MLDFVLSIGIGINPKFYGDYEFLFNLTSAQWLRRFHELPVYFRKISMKLASELCSMYSSKD